MLRDNPYSIIKATQRLDSDFSVTVADYQGPGRWEFCTAPILAAAILTLAGHGMADDAVDGTVRVGPFAVHQSDDGFVRLSDGGERLHDEGLIADSDHVACGKCGWDDDGDLFVAADPRHILHLYGDEGRPVGECERCDAALDASTVRLVRKWPVR